jgi:hypothetical protein
MCIALDLIETTCQLGEDIVIGRMTRDARPILGDEMVASLMQAGLTRQQIIYLAQRHENQGASIMESCQKT